MLLLMSLVPALSQGKQTRATTRDAKKGPAAKTAPAPKPKPKPKPTPTPKADNSAKEKEDLQKAIDIEDATARIKALERFIRTYPRSKNVVDAREVIVKVNSDLGNERLAASDVTEAMKYFTAAVTAAPQPLGDTLFSEILVKFAPNLFFRGARKEAVDLTKLLEAKTEGNSEKTLALAGFYLSIEDGADAARLANAVIAEKPSAAAYQTLALAKRIDFDIEGSTEAFEKALELDNSSTAARRGLAETKRSLGKPEEALALYNTILEKDPKDVPARTGVVLSLFDLGKRTEAEAEMSSLMADSPGNVILLASAAYWYASHDMADQAVEFAQKAIAADPRFIWSHIALARGYADKNDFPAAEKALLKARQYGNFPTLDYELARILLEQGFYREAAETLDHSFAVEGDKVAADLGFRVRRSADDLIGLIALERRSSIFLADANEDKAIAQRLRNLLDFEVKVQTSRDAQAVLPAADAFIAGDDKMQVFRRLFVANELLNEKLDADRVIELAREAMAGVDDGVTQKAAVSATLADELYDPRALASSHAEYVELPIISRSVLSSIIRGRIEDIAGEALLIKGDTDAAVIRLRRAVSVLPTDSVWWRTSTWRLARALEESKPEESLDLSIKSYKAGPPDIVKYGTIEALYKKINGGIEGLEAKIGANPLYAVKIADNTPTPEPTPETAPSMTPAATPELVPVTAQASPELSPEPVASPTQKEAAEPTPTPEPSPEAAASPIPKEAAEPTPTPEPSPEAAASPIPKEAAEPTPTPEPSPEAAASPTQKEAAEPTPTPEPSPSPTATTDSKDTLFPPVVIVIPKPAAKDAEPKGTPQPEPEPKPCTLTVSEDMLTFTPVIKQLAVVLGTETDEDLTDLSGNSLSPENVAVRRESIPEVKTRAIYIIGPLKDEIGEYEVEFALPCGRKKIAVRVVR